MNLPLASGSDADGASIRFVASFPSALPPGEYTLDLVQTIEAAGEHNTFVHKARFAIAGERFSLDPAEVASVFPPQGAQGEFFNVLPHAVITRRTLPWERALMHDGAVQAAPLPWLAVLVLD